MRREGTIRAEEQIADVCKREGHMVPPGDHITCTLAEVVTAFREEAEAVASCPREAGVLCAAALLMFLAAYRAPGQREEEGSECLEPLSDLAGRPGVRP